MSQTVSIHHFTWSSTTSWDQWEPPTSCPLRRVLFSGRRSEIKKKTFFDFLQANSESDFWRGERGRRGCRERSRCIGRLSTVDWPTHGHSLHIYWPVVKSKKRPDNSGIWPVIGPLLERAPTLSGAFCDMPPPLSTSYGLMGKVTPYPQTTSGRMGKVGGWSDMTTLSSVVTWRHFNFCFLKDLKLSDWKTRCHHMSKKKINLFDSNWLYPSLECQESQQWMTLWFPWRDHTSSFVFCYT